MTVQFKRLRPGAIMPEYKSDFAAGMDIHAYLDQPITLNPGERSVLIPTGFAAYVGAAGIAYMIFPRSGLGHKNGLVLGNGTGVIDADYQGELMVSACIRPGHDPFTINHGDRIAQIVFLSIVRAHFTEVDDFQQFTSRGANGFGSTGT